MLLPKLFLGHTLEEVEVEANLWLETAPSQVREVDLALCGNFGGFTNFSATVVFWWGAAATETSSKEEQKQKQKLKLFRWAPTNAHYRDGAVDEQIRKWLEENKSVAVVSTDLANTGEYGLTSHLIAIAVLYVANG